MKPTKDSFGQALLCHLQGKKAHEIFERDDGFFDASPNLNGYFSEYKDWPPHVRKAMKYARGKLLDIGCGAGRICLHFQKKGLDVLGIDISPLAIDVCRRRGVKNVKVMSITEINSGLGQFDTLIMAGNNFGLFGSFNRARLLLKRFYRMMSPTGQIIAQTLDPYNTMDKDILAYLRLNRQRGRMGGQVRLRIRYRNLVGPWFDYLFVSKKEMKQILVGTGWKVKKFLDSKGPNYIVVLEKDNLNK